MLQKNGFDLWADSYDESVNLSEEANEYPFAGYKKVLGSIYETIKQGEGSAILDIGFGTGVLAKKLYDDGCKIYGIDFSEKMVAIAKAKMPQATLLQHDFKQGLPEVFKEEKFDYIVCTYALHHLEDDQKITFLQELLTHLSFNGYVLIGDVAFETVKQMMQCKEKSKAAWDDEESYPIVELLKPAFPSLRFEKIAFCSGILSFEK